MLLPCHSATHASTWPLCYTLQGDLPLNLQSYFWSLLEIPPSLLIVLKIKSKTHTMAQKPYSI